MANTRKNGAYTQGRGFVKWKGLKAYYVPQHLLQDSHCNICTTCKEARRPK